ncbi:SH3 domain-containing protein [Mycena maculata]|uniref:SH3 domain-containing protein n=1 Tax=Mycena maculata TaxID=230809 RepID=A0AAD7HJ38_9AGAR|nr:SH3 domain-containing protein [Mycena maculata]
MDSPLAHIISQTRQNIEFLMAQNQISPDDGRKILAHLPSAPDRSMAALEQQTQNLLITPPSSAPPRRLGQSVKAKALWGYNEEQEDDNDLTFHVGDTIEIVEETNADWWTGRHNGKQGLFPSNYVEKLRTPPSEPPYPARDSYSNMPSFPNQPPQPAYQPPPGPYPGPPKYQSPGGYQPSYQPPPGPPRMGSQYNSYGGPPPQAPVIVQQAPPPADAPPKKHKFGNLGNTLAQSAAGGVGFGAGSAVGSGIVNAIF